MMNNRHIYNLQNNRHIYKFNSSLFKKVKVRKSNIDCLTTEI